MNLAIWHPRKVQSATIYQVTDRLHDGRTARVPGDEITSTVSGWLSELGTQSPLADELTRAVRIGDWPAAPNGVVPKGRLPIRWMTLVPMPSRWTAQRSKVPRRIEDMAMPHPDSIAASYMYCSTRILMGNSGFEL